MKTLIVILVAIGVVSTFAVVSAVPTLVFESYESPGFLIKNKVPGKQTFAFQIENTTGTPVFSVKGETGNVVIQGAVNVQSNLIYMTDDNGCLWIVHVHTDGVIGTHPYQC